MTRLFKQTTMLSVRQLSDLDLIIADLSRDLTRSVTATWVVVDCTTLSTVVLVCLSPVNQPHASK